jgi:ParB/RepB/Spo0J family partition protein
MAPRPKLDPAEIAKIRARKAADPTLTNQSIADEFGVSRTTLQKALGAESPAAANSTIAELDLALLSPSLLNPRRTFNEESILQLAETIADKGLLQNLMVRRPVDHGLSYITDAAGTRHNGFYDIVFGERRYRALQRLAKQGRWNKAVPCIIVDIDDATHLALALLENVQREDVPPVEEADGLARLHRMDPETYSTEAIAARIGRSQRYVQQRIAISENLVEPAKLLLTHQLMNIECSRLLAGESHAVQMEILTDWDLDDVTEDTNFDQLDLVAVPITADATKDAIHWIHERQDREKAAAARAAAPQPQSEMRLDRAAAEDPSPRDEPPSAAPTLTPPPQPEPEAGPTVTKSHIYHAHRRKTAALRDALSLDHANALRAACMALLGPQAVVLILRNSPISDDEPGPDMSIEATIKRILNNIKPPDYHGDTKAQLKLWAQLQKVKGPDLESLFSALVARQVHTPAGHQALLGDDPLAEAIAQALKIPGHEEDFGLALQPDDLTGLRKPALLAIADEIGTQGVNDATKIGDLQETIKANWNGDDYVIPTLRFGSTKQLQKSLAELGK